VHPEINHEQLKQYRQAAADLDALRRDVGERIDRAKQGDDLAAGYEALSELETRMEDFKNLRSSLTPLDLFRATYNVEVHGPYEVSFVIPRGTSRFDLLREAYDFLPEDQLVSGLIQLRVWATEPSFTEASDATERVHIKVHDDRRFQETKELNEYLEEKNAVMASFEDVVTAFAVHFVATQDALFPENEDTLDTELVMTTGASLRFDSVCGLFFEPFIEGSSPVMVAERVSSRPGK
jgi:hypothetical protein